MNQNQKRNTTAVVRRIAQQNYAAVPKKLRKIKNYSGKFAIGYNLIKKKKKKKKKTKKKKARRVNATKIVAKIR